MAGGAALAVAAQGGRRSVRAGGQVRGGGDGKSGTCAELSTVYRRLSLRDAPVVDLEVIARVVEKPRTSPTTVCSVEL